MKSIDELLHADVNTIPTAVVAETWLALTMIEKLIEERKKQLRPRLLEEASAHGAKDPTSGSFKLNLGGSSVVKERREERQININKMVALLTSKELPIETACDEQISWVVNLSKVQHLVHNGTLTTDEVDALKGVTWALKVSPSKELKASLDEGQALLKGSK